VSMVCYYVILGGPELKRKGQVSGLAHRAEKGVESIDCVFLWPGCSRLTKAVPLTKVTASMTVGEVERNMH
jgi:hypothetical protein